MKDTREQFEKETGWKVEYVETPKWANTIYYNSDGFQVDEKSYLRELSKWLEHQNKELIEEFVKDLKEMKEGKDKVIDSQKDLIEVTEKENKELK